MIDNQADQLEQASDNMNGAAEDTAENRVDQLEEQADAVRNEGDEKADAIDDAN